MQVIYFTRLSNGQVWLLFLYAKSILDSVASHKLKEMKDAIEKTIV